MNGASAAPGGKEYVNHKRQIMQDIQQPAGFTVQDTLYFPSWLVHTWFMVGSWLVHGWFMRVHGFIVSQHSVRSISTACNRYWLPHVLTVVT